MADQGYESALVTAAIGKYLARQPLTAAEAALINSARALLGPPPVGDFPVELEPAGPVTTTPPPSEPAAKPPGVPGNIHFPTRDRMQIAIAWNAVAGASRYEIERIPGSGIITTQATSQLVGPLTPGTMYRWRVRAVGTGGTGAWSPQVECSTKP